VRSEVLIEVDYEITVLWKVSLVRLSIYPVDGASRFLQNGNALPDYTVSNYKRQKSLKKICQNGQ
jgi:hypothetical protein